MTEKRFELGKSENQDTIFDNEGPDDYYHLGNDTEDVKALCKLLNELHEENQELKKENENLKQTIETQIFNYNNAKSIIHSSEKQIWRLEDRIEELKKLTLYFLSCATGETSSNYDKDMDIWCNEIFGCNYQEADKKYGDDESIWELETKIFKEKEE